MRLAIGAVLVVGTSVAVFFAACGDSSNCKPGHLSLQIQLYDTANLADTIIVTDGDGLGVDDSFPHTPSSNPIGLFAVDVASGPGGYPADGLVHLVAKAVAGRTILATTTQSIRFGHTCTDGAVGLQSFATPDAAPTD